MTATQQLKVFTFILTILALLRFDLGLFISASVFGWILSGIAVSVLYHRKISHRTFEYKNTFFEYLSYLLMIMSGQGTPLGWAIIHRTHHSKTDTLDDPQSPHSVGKFRTMISWYKIDNVNPKLVIDILRDKKLMFLHNHYNKLFLLYATILLLIDPGVCLYFAGLSVTVCAFFLGVVNTFGHNSPVKIDDSYVTNILGQRILWGEALHKDHHTNPSNAKIGANDWGYYFIKLIGKPRV